MTALVVSAACAGNPRPVSPGLAGRPTCFALVRQGVLIAPVMAPGPPSQTPSGEIMRAMVRTGVDTVPRSDTVLLRLTDSIVEPLDRPMRRADTYFRDTDGSWRESSGPSGWETSKDSLIVLHVSYGEYSRSAIPLAPMAGVGAFLAETHTGAREEGSAWLVARSCGDLAP